MKAHIDCIFCDRLKLLNEDPFFIFENEHIAVFLGDHQFYRGYCIVVTKSHVRELFELKGNESQTLMNCLKKVGEIIFECYSPWKLNYASFGNVVEHLHWHVIPRYDGDVNKLLNPWANAERFSESPSIPVHANVLQEAFKRFNDPIID